MSNRFTKEFGEHPSDVVICASMSHVAQWMELADRLTDAGYTVHVPDTTEHATWDSLTDEEVAQQKGVYVRKHLGLISATKSVLVCNYRKNGVEDYIGANTFLEMSAAYTWEKPVYVLNGIPDTPNRDEILAMQPTVLHGDLGQLEQALSTPAELISQ